MKKLTLIKIVLTIVFFCILFYKIDFKSIIVAFQSLNIFFLGCSFAIVPILYVLRTWRWSYFLSSVGVTLPFYRTLKIILIGTFYGLITPGKLGEFGKAFHINEKKTITIPTIIMEKILDVGVLIVLSVVTIQIFFQDSTFMKTTIFLITMVAIGALIISMNEKFFIFTGNFFRISKEDTGIFTYNYTKILKNYPAIFKSVAITFVYYSLVYVSAFFIVLSGSMKFSCIFVMPIVVLMGNIPITISGLGLRESIGSLTFVLLGESAANGFVFSLLLFIFITVLPSIGGYIFLMREGMK